MVRPTKLSELRLCNGSSSNVFQPKKNLYQLDASGDDLPNQYDIIASDGDGNWNLDPMGYGPKCGKCGSRKHSSNACDADLSKVRCSNVRRMDTAVRIVPTEKEKAKANR